MKKSTFIKRFVSLLLVVLMSINTFAAVVGDNDGAAFITKGEFDSMKNDFQSQLDRYNSSIDNKIDGAIASYLAGVKVAATLKLNNNYDKISPPLLWSSSSTYSLNSTRPRPKRNIKYEQSYTSTAFYRIYSEPNVNTYMFYGASDDAGNYYVDSLRDMIPTCDFYVHYMFGTFRINENATIVSRTPDFKTGFNNVSLNNPNFVQQIPYDPQNTSTSSGGSWRSITSSMSYSTDPQPVASSMIVAPFSSTNTYVYDVGTSVASTKASNYATEWIYLGSTYWGSVVDVRKDTTVQTVDPAGLVWPGNNYVQCLAWGSIKFPWLHNQKVMKNLYYNSIVAATGKDYPISAGVCLVDIESDGIFKTKVTASANGTAMFASQNSPPTSWGTPSSHVTNVKYFNCQSNTTTSIEFECEKNDGIWFIYYPSNTSTMATVSFSDTTLTVS